MSDKGRSEYDGGGDEEPRHAGVEVPNKQRRYAQKIKRAKQVVVSPFGNVKRKLHRKKRSSYASPPGPGEGGCCLCFMPPLRSDSTVNPQTTDPKSPEVSYGALKVLIEKNDFFSRECNVHMDIS